MSFKNTQLCGGGDDEDREYKEWQAQQAFEKSIPNVISENKKFLGDLMEIPEHNTNAETQKTQEILQMNNITLEGNTKLETADHTARFCKGDIPLVNMAHKNHDDDDNNENTTQIISSLTQAANGSSMLDHLATTIFAQPTNDPYQDQFDGGMNQCDMQSGISY